MSAAFQLPLAAAQEPGLAQAWQLRKAWHASSLMGLKVGAGLLHSGKCLYNRGAPAALCAHAKQ